MKGFIVSFCLLILVFKGISQSSSQFTISYYSTENGLPSNGIKGLQWDAATGFLWIATEAGIARFNGQEFKNFTRDDDPMISTDRFLFLVRNNAGRIYSADNRGSIYYISKNKLVYLHKEFIIGNHHTNIIAYEVSDTLKKSRMVNPTPSSFSLQFEQALPDGDTALFVVHNSGLYRISVNNAEPQFIDLGGHTFKNSFKSGNNFFLIDQDNQVFLFDKITYRINKIPVADQTGGSIPLINNEALVTWKNGMSHPVLFSQGKAWVLNYNGSQLFARLICDKVPANNLIRYAQYDEMKKILFIGTDSRGVIIIKQNQVATVKKSKIVANERTSYYSQIELPGNLILTNEGHVIGNGQPGKVQIPITGKFHPSVLLTGDTALWFSRINQADNRYCLHKYSYRTGKTTVYSKIITGNQSALAITDGRLYLANESGIRVMTGDTTETLYTYSDEGAIRLHYDMCELGKGKLGIATCNAFLQLDIINKRLDTLYNTGNYCVRTLWRYEDYVFVGTYGNGFFIYKNNKIVSLPLDKNKYLLYTHCFVKDDSGYVWISTNKGLFKAQLKEILDVFENRTSSVYYHYFGRNDGMETTELNGGCTPCAITMKNKVISFPSMDGLLWVDPGNMHPSMPEGEIFIDGIYADNISYQSFSSSVPEFPAKTGELVFKLGLPAWSNNENLYLDFQLNENEMWRPVNIEKGSDIRFNNLAPGEYKLKIRKRNGFGAGNYFISEYQFNITIPWYKKWWFNFIILLFISGMIMLFVRIRTNQLKQIQVKLERLVDEKTKELQEKNTVLEKNDSIKTRLISIISHDIVTPLKFLTAAGKNLMEKRKLMPEELQQETLNEMTNTSQELQLLSTNILNWIKYQNENRRLAKELFDVNEIVNQVFSVLYSLARQKKLNLVNDIPAGTMIYQYFEPLKILIYNLVSNAINFTEAGKITVRIKTNPDTVTISVKDDGVGMTTEQIKNIMADEFIISSANIDNRKGNGLGYLIIKDLLKTMEGQLHIESERVRPDDPVGRGKGTEVFITIPSGYTSRTGES